MLRLCLGTAQFGLDYGISNEFGKIGHSSAQKSSIWLFKMTSEPLIPPGQGGAEDVLEARYGLAP